MLRSILACLLFFWYFQSLTVVGPAVRAGIPWGHVPQRTCRFSGLLDVRTSAPLSVKSTVLDMK